MKPYPLYATYEKKYFENSKTLKNKISGRITRAVKRELFEKEEKLKRELASTNEQKDAPKPVIEE